MTAAPIPTRYDRRLIAALLLAAIGLAMMLYLGFRPGGLLGRRVPDEELFVTLRQAINATESLQAEAADEDWESLFAELPEDRAVTLNRALNRLLAVESLVGLVRQDADTPQARDAALAKLPEALSRARQAVDDHGSAGAPPAELLWLSSRIDLSEAALLEPDQANAIREKVLRAISDWVTGDPSATRGGQGLAGVWLQAHEELGFTGRTFEAQQTLAASATLRRFLALQPDNLYLALRAARLGIAARDPEAAAAVATSRQLSRAIEPILRLTTQAIGLTPDELSQQIIDATEAQQWPDAELKMNLWFNALNSSELVKTDRKRVSLHPLDRISYETMRRLAQQIRQGQPQPMASGPVTFGNVASGSEEGVLAALAVDIDLDLRPEVVSLSEQGQITVSRVDLAEGTPPETLASLNLELECAGMLAADLFMVDASDPNRLQATPATAEPPAAPGSSETSAMSAGAPPARHTTFQSLVIFGPQGVRLVAVDGRPTTTPDARLSLVATETGLEDLANVSAAIAGDLDGDGDLDLAFATRDRGVRLFVNRGNRTFYEVDQSAESGFYENSRDVAAMAIVDLDRDLDLDIVCLLNASGKVAVVENLLHLQFRFRELSDIPATPGAKFLQVADYDGNVSWDLLVAGADQTRVVYSQTTDAGAWRVEQVESLDPSSANPLVADWDNDSWQEILFPSAADQAAPTARRLGGAVQATEVSVVGAPAGRWVVAQDFDLDGRLDILSIEAGRWRIDRNTTEAPGNFLNLRFRGIDDNSAASGRVNHYAIGSVIEAWFGTNYRAAIVTQPTTHFGLGGYETADSLRIIFPNGLTQMVLRPGPNSMIEEEQTLKGSCPYLYAWNGERFAFVTDCLWAAPLGLQVAQNVVAADRPWEYLKVDGKYLTPRDGFYELRITEELWEVAYLDHLELMAVDHPESVEIWTNEKVGPPQIATPQIHAFAAEDRLPLKRGLDTQGRDVTGELAAQDENYVKAFDTRLLQGLCPPHWVDLDFGPLPPAAEDGKTFLVITGWILPTDSSLNIQIDQNPDLPAVEYPSVWVPDATADSGWREAIPFMGFPGGKTKTIVVDVSDVIVRSDPRLRVRTSAQIYWDSASLAVRREQPPINTQIAPLVSADLHARGFSAKRKPSERAPETYDYDLLSPGPKWPPLGGRFTDLGDRLELVTAWDDAMVVMAPGDELQLRFRVPEQPVPPGWKRDFVLHCVGWDKDADLNTLAGQSSEPLPFRVMKSYPPLPDQSADGERVEELNRRHTRRTQSFRAFWSPIRGD
jgi:hypothetical protein